MPPKRGGKAPAFPAARVKRIMQQDDDVGKVATASPIVMAKATELFLQEMITAIEKEARAKATRKVTLHHVKRAVENAASLDFLKDLVSSIPDPAGADEGDESGDTKSKKRAPRAAAAKGAATSAAAAAKAEGSASPALYGTQSPLPAAASTSTSASGLKKIKISHQASNISSGVKTEETMVPSTSSMSEPSSTTTTAAPPPLSPSKVAIPISSLLNSSTEDYDDAPAFGTSEPQEDAKPAAAAERSGMDEDDNYDDEAVGATQNGGEAVAPNGDASMQASASEETPSTRPALQRGEEDDNYDDD